MDCLERVLFQMLTNYSQHSKWKFRSAGIILKSETRIYHQKYGKRQMDIIYRYIDN
jgi:hypothetical protein